MKKVLQNKKIARKHSGFSLVEVLVSVFLITTGLLASVNLISSSMRDSMDARNQLIAGQLAQEGVELVRNIRDNNWASADSGGSFAHITTGNDCRIDKSYLYPAAIDCTAGVSAKRLYLNNIGGFYVHSSVDAIATRFYRKLIISGVSDRTIISMISWSGIFPADIATCNTVNKCAYTKIILSSWGE